MSWDDFHATTVGVTLSVIERSATMPSAQVS